MILYVGDVKTKKPNILGLYDMSGNVDEWFWDWKGNYPNRVTDLINNIQGDSPLRIFRGGNYLSINVNQLSVASSNSLEPSRENSYTGFRVVRSQ